MLLLRKIGGSMYCSKCGKEIADNAEICMNCGCAVEKFVPPKKKNGCLLAAFIVFGSLIFLGLLGTVIEEASNSLSQNSGSSKDNSSIKCIPLDKQTYDSIKVGDSYKQLEKLKDYCGEVAVESNFENYANGGIVVFYGKPLGSNANFTVMNGKIITKAQIGLK